MLIYALLIESTATNNEIFSLFFTKTILSFEKKL